MVPRVAEHADLVLHLHRQDGVLLAVHLADVAHQGGEGPRVAVTSGVAKGGNDVQGLAGAVFYPREALRVGLDPGRLVGGFAVLPASEPEDDQAQVIFPGALKGVVHGGEIEAAFLRLDRFPGDDRQDGVEIPLRQLRPERLHVGAAGGAGIVQFAGRGIRNGLPSTTSWRTPCRVSKCGWESSAAACAVGWGGQLRGGQGEADREEMCFHCRLVVCCSVDLSLSHCGENQGSTGHRVIGRDRKSGCCFRRKSRTPSFCKKKNVLAGRAKLLASRGSVGASPSAGSDGERGL